MGRPITGSQNPGPIKPLHIIGIVCYFIIACFYKKCNVKNKKFQFGTKNVLICKCRRNKVTSERIGLTKNVFLQNRKHALRI